MKEKLKKLTKLDDLKIEELSQSLQKILPKYNIKTDDQVNMFLAQCCHESGYFKHTVENLNYSEQGLKTIFGKYFTGIQAQLWARKPEQIANKVYANRMGNGDPQSGDGWKFRGRGYIQLTGRENYTRFSSSINKTLDETIEYLGTVDGCVESAAWFWFINNLNKFADNLDVTGATKKINGGTIGLAERTELFHRLKD